MRGREDALGVHAVGHLERREARGAVDVAHAAAVVVLLALGHVLLGLLADLGHRLDGLDRVLAGRGLTGEHDAVGAVVDGVGDVGDLGARGARVALHGVEHLRGRDDGLVVLVALADDRLLDVRDLGGRDLHAQVAAGDHAAVGLVEDLVEVLHAERALDLGEDEDVGRAHLDADLADLLDGLAVADEGGGDGVDAQLAAKHDVRTVLGGDGGQADVDVGDVHALALAEQAAVGDLAVHVGALDVVDLQADQTVVDQDDGALLHLVGQLLVVEREALGGADDVVIGGHDAGLAGLQLDLLAVLEQAGAHLGALGVEQDGNRDGELTRELADALDVLAVVLVGAVGEVEARDVHAMQDELAQHLLVLHGGTHGAHDLGLLLLESSHLSLSLRSDRGNRGRAVDAS